MRYVAATSHKAILRGMTRAVLTALALMLLALPAAARDRGQFADVPAATREWFKSLHSIGGAWCCDREDGTRIEDPDWRPAADGGYEIWRNGSWEKVPAEALVPGTNRVGFAVLWAYEGWGAITCFMPGSLG